MSAARKLRRRFASVRLTLPLTPGVQLMTVRHDAHCRAPVLACTCAPTIEIERATPDEIAVSARADRERRAAIKSTLD